MKSVNSCISCMGHLEEYVIACGMIMALIKDTILH